METLFRYASNTRRGAFHYVQEIAGGVLVALCGRRAEGMHPIPSTVRHTECRKCAAKHAARAEQAAPVEAPATVEEQTEAATLYRPAAPRSRGVGHYRRPGTIASYCGRTVEAQPSNDALFTGTCKPCAKAERADRVAAEQRAAAFSVDTPPITERAGVRCCTVGAGRRVHLSNNDETLCGREVTEYDDGALLVKGSELCTLCYRAAEERAYTRALAAASPLAAAAVELAETVEQATALVTEAEAGEGTWRGDWIGEQPAGDTLFDVEPAAEQGALFTKGDQPTREAVKVRMPPEPSGLASIRAKAAADREDFRAKMDERQAADHLAHGVPVPAALQARIDARRTAETDPEQVEQVPARRVIEGVIVEHNGTAEGSTPGDAGHPNVIAARAVLNHLAAARMTEDTDVSRYAEAVDPTVRGYLIEPREGARVAVYWLEEGRIVRRDTPINGASLDCLAYTLARRGWTVEKMLKSSQCVFAHRPTNPADRPVWCDAHEGQHAETPECQHPHEVAPAGPEPTVGHPYQITD
ncbi:hypothetical protein ACIQPR_05160 [Streptomyces sp. NPDC091280]|uniref:hypothetical protein n=1 Tax=Streptomyces sp. NPDC091280 TaxID=3365984 RepID=UPI00382DD565